MDVTQTDDERVVRAGHCGEGAQSDGQNQKFFIFQNYFVVPFILFQYHDVSFYQKALNTICLPR